MPVQIEELGEVFPVLGSGLPRAEGLHLTDIIRHIQDQINPYTGKGFDDAQITMEMGFIWEDLLSFILGNRIGTRLNDLEHDGIFMNPDGLGLDPRDGHTAVVEEYKCTWKSLNNFTPTSNPRWMMQIMAYCYVLETRIAVMYVLFVNGNYRGSGPLSRTYRIEFDQAELEQNWQVILDHKEATIEAMKEADAES